MKEKWDKVTDFRYKPGMKVQELVENFSSLGFQAIKLGQAVEIVKEMKKQNAKIILSFTSNMVTSGLRGLFAQLIELGFVDFIVTTVGSIEEDFIKAHQHEFVIGDYSVNDEKLSAKGLNRIGNIYIPNESYIAFEKNVRPILERLYEQKKCWQAKELIAELGKHVEDENSILHQASKKNIPIYCPAIMDGALGLQLSSFQMEHSDFTVDVVKDLTDFTFDLFEDQKVGAIILGGGVSKHFTILAGLMRDGMDYAIYITTSNEYSGSASGATTNEAKSWGKLKGTANAVTIHGEASIIFPLLVTKVLDDMNKES